MSTIYDPSIIVAYEDPIISQFPYVSTLSVGAYSESNNTNNLTIGASSNLLLQARQGIELYFNSNQDISFFTSSTLGCNVQKILSIGLSNNQTFLSASNLIIKLNGRTNIGNTVLVDSNNYQFLEIGRAHV